MDAAQRAGLFNDVIRFHNFPRGSCGDTCYLLAEFLLQHDIQTEYVWGSAYSQSHAWLVVADSIAVENNKTGLGVRHSLSNDRTIIDITGDQFRSKAKFLNYSCPVYIGEMDTFHRLFSIHDIHECRGLSDERIVCDCRLRMLYEKIHEYIYEE